MNILICDDQQAEADRLTSLLTTECTTMRPESGFDIKIVQFVSGKEALDHIHCGASVDVCFLDIFMPQMNGVTLAEKLRLDGYRGEIVFLTTSNDFAHQSYQVDALDYMLKPPTPESIRNILRKLEEKLKNADKNGLSVKTQGGSSFILFRNISHIEVIDHTVYIRLLNGNEIKVNTTFAETSGQLLSDSRFIQCHRSYIVNMSDIESITDKCVVMQNGAKVPISRGFTTVRNDIMKWMFGKGGK